MKPIFLLLLLELLHYSAAAAVVLYPAPRDEPRSADYQVRIRAQPVDVYTARVLDSPFAGKEWDYGGPYSFCNFDVEGAVDVRISSNRSLRNTVVKGGIDAQGQNIRIQGRGILDGSGCV